MSELILHHYDLSLYAEKIRAVLGFKGLAWRSVHIPIVMPKPDLTALTGGYRLTPVLQVGADIYCDSKVIARRLEQERPEPSLYSKNTPALERAVSVWGEAMFMSLVQIGFASGVLPREFVEDRKKILPDVFDETRAREVMPSRFDHIRATLDLLEQQLADERPFILGGAAGLADFSVYPTLSTMRARLGTFFERCPRVVAWLDRIHAFGHGTPSEMESGEAVRIAQQTKPTTEPAEDPADPSGRRMGDRIRAFPEAYGRDPVEGELVRADAHSIAIRRRDERVGEVVVHFPREGMIILAA